MSLAWPAPDDGTEETAPVKTVRETAVSGGPFRRGGPVIRLVAALGVALGLLSVTVHALEYRGPERFSKDFAIDYSSALAVRNGGDPYAPIKELVDRYLHPPPGVLRSHVLSGGNWHPPFKVAATVPLTY